MLLLGLLLLHHLSNLPDHFSLLIRLELLCHLFSELGQFFLVIPEPAVHPTLHLRYLLLHKCIVLVLLLLSRLLLLWCNLCRLGCPKRNSGFPLPLPNFPFQSRDCVLKTVHLMLSLHLVCLLLF